MTTIATAASQLRNLGLHPGSVVLVHSSFSAVGPIEGGPTGLITALEQAIGPAGTLVMPSLSDDDDHPFDPQSTPCRSLGIVPDTFWRLEGVLRSDSPHAFAARGPAAPTITAPHPADCPHGPGTPVDRVYRLDGDVLLLGVDHDANTTIHLAEAMAGVRYRRPKRLTLLQDGVPVRLDYLEIDHCCQNFRLVGGWLARRGLERRGPVGRAQARVVRARDLIEVVVAELEADETAFLHPVGVDEECDEARASLTLAPATPRRSHVP